MARRYGFEQAIHAIPHVNAAAAAAAGFSAGLAIHEVHRLSKKCKCMHVCMQFRYGGHTITPISSTWHAHCTARRGDLQHVAIDNHRLPTTSYFPSTIPPQTAGRVKKPEVASPETPKNCCIFFFLAGGRFDWFA